QKPKKSQAEKSGKGPKVRTSAFCCWFLRHFFFWRLEFWSLGVWEFGSFSIDAVFGRDGRPRPSGRTRLRQLKGEILGERWIVGCIEHSDVPTPDGRDAHPYL